MFTDIIAFLVSKDITIQMLPDSVREETVSSLVTISSQKAFESLQSEISGEKRMEFEKLMELHDEVKIEAFLKTHVPHFQEIVTAVTREQLEEFLHALHRGDEKGRSL